jgi:uncharacterized protein with HEPN domain
MSKPPDEYLKHILKEIDYLMGEVEKTTLVDLVKDETKMRAFARSLEIIGEAAKKITKDFKESKPDIDWKAMAGMRDRLVHEYFGVDYEIVWDVVTNELPELRLKLEALVKI